MRMIILVLFLLSLKAHATVQVPNFECPDQFEGVVTEVVDAFGPESSLSTHKVIFTVDRMIKGDLKEKFIVDVLKYGPFDLEQGAHYEVHLKNGRICSIERL